MIKKNKRKIALVLLTCILSFCFKRTYSIQTNNFVTSAIKNTIIFTGKEITSFTLKCLLNQPMLVLLGSTIIISAATIFMIKSIINKIEKVIGSTVIIGFGIAGLLILSNHLDQRSISTKKKGA